MRTEENAGAIPRIGVSGGGGWNVSSVWSNSEAAGVKTADMAPASRLWNFTTAIQRPKSSLSATSAGLGSDSSPKGRSAIFCARIATEGGITIEEER